jgi:hypothetical protein
LGAEAAEFEVVVQDGERLGRPVDEMTPASDLRPQAPAFGFSKDS